MSRRENFYKTLTHETPDNIIIDLGGNPTSSIEGDTQYRMMDELGYKYSDKERCHFGKTQTIDERILEYLDIDTRAVGSILKPKDSQSQILGPNAYIDEWGIKRTFDGKYWDNIHNPLKGTTIDDLKNFKWPNPESIDYEVLEGYVKKAKYLYEETDYVVCGEHPVYGIFETGCWMCGFDDYLLKMIIDPDYIKYFSEKVFEYQMRISEIYYKAIGKYIHFTSSGDDFATQNSMFMSLDMFRDNLKPYLKNRITRTKKYCDVPFLAHSCGQVYELIPDLIDCGVDILNPIQPTSQLMAPEKLKKEYGHKVVYHGGLDTQQVLPSGSTADVEVAVDSLVNAMNINGGYIFAAAHNIQDDVPIKNVISMYHRARKTGRK